MRSGKFQVRVPAYNRTVGMVPSGWSSWHKNNAQKNYEERCNYKNGSPYVKEELDAQRININVKDSDIID